MTETPDSLDAGGRSLWEAITAEHQLDAGQLAQLLEACRAKDRLDRLDVVLRGDTDTWMRLTHRLNTDDYELKIDAALSQANATANVMKQLLAALRLPDAKTGRRPQARNARGAYKPSGTVTSLDKFRTG